MPSPCAADALPIAACGAVCVFSKAAGAFLSCEKQKARSENRLSSVASSAGRIPCVLLTPFSGVYVHVSMYLSEVYIHVSVNKNTLQFLSCLLQ